MDPRLEIRCLKKLVDTDISCQNKSVNILILFVVKNLKRKLVEKLNCNITEDINTLDKNHNSFSMLDL